MSDLTFETQFDSNCCLVVIGHWSVNALVKQTDENGLKFINLLLTLIVPKIVWDTDFHLERQTTDTLHIYVVHF